MAETLKKQLRFTGQIVNVDLKDRYKSLGVDYESDDGFVQTGHHSLSIAIDSNGHFSFNLPDLNKPYKIHLYIYNAYALEVRGLWSYDGYAESGDDIKMRIVLKAETLDSVYFSGQGCNKYNLTHKLHRQFSKYYYPSLSMIGLEYPVDNWKELDVKLNQVSNLIRRFKAKKLNLINTARVNAEMKRIINYEFAAYNEEWVWRLTWLFQQMPAYRYQISQVYLKYKGEFFDNPTTLSLFCPKYIINLSSREILDLMIFRNSDKIEIKTYYDRIKSHYSGTLRDRLFGTFIFSKVPYIYFLDFDNHTKDSLYNDAASLIKVPYVKRAVLQKIEDLAKVNGNTRIFDAEFVGLDGKMFKLNSLKGTIYLIDAWFLGCSGCANFHNDFEKKVYPKFKDKANFIVLSINFDGNKEKWLKGIESKLYTSLDYVNVYTGGFKDKNGYGLNHPFMKYFNVKGGPYLMLVDGNGVIRYQSYNTTAEAITLKINEVLSD
ncbi:thioredoxin family protein [Pedobacter sp. MC2016-14]|uniref:peroxiredoxin family protein n=1 Tax=Pedobacter sp. MC2016-14 TaxID=2897327 RepID=UPI001E3E5453|nr:thioredoxin family protein [Pedobacter sp. MC2016-14]MCD0488320.1 thioredoxin family protein [Pedobacter sp. MC2016-14]